MKRSVITCDYKGCDQEVHDSSLCGDDWRKNVDLPGAGRFHLVIRALRDDCVQGEREEVDLCDEHRDAVLRLIAAGTR